jgi:hypothetical protein
MGALTRRVVVRRVVVLRVVVLRHEDGEVIEISDDHPTVDAPLSLMESQLE